MIHVRQVADLFLRKGKTLHDLGKTRFELGALVLVIRAALGREVKDGPEVVLQDRSLERIGDQPLAVVAQKLIEHINRVLMRVGLKQMLRIGPEQNVQRVLSKWLASGPGSDMQNRVEAIPEMIRIRIV